jgi:hypothetical protein
MTIYVVMGSTGEYSDHDEWMVKAFTSEVAAQRFVQECDLEAKRIDAVVEAAGWYFTYVRDNPAAQSACDPRFRRDYTGTTYSYESVELISEPEREQVA